MKKCEHNIIYPIGIQELPSINVYLKLGNCFSCRATICYDGEYHPTSFYITNKRIKIHRELVLSKLK